MPVFAYPEMANEYQYLNDIYRKVFVEDWVGIVEIDMSGSRWSAKTKSVEKLCVKSLLNQDKKVRIVCGKYTVDGARELWSEFEEEFAYLPEKTITTNKTERVAKHRDNEMKVLGFKSNRSEKIGKLGIKRGVGVDVLIIFVDEMLQWQDSKELSALYQACGGAKTIIKIRATNPFTPYHWYIGMIHSKYQIKERVMREKGQMFFSETLTEDFEGDKIEKILITHYSNHRVNEYLSPAQHQELVDTWKTNPHQARVIDLGLMGVEDGAIYEYVLEQMTSYTHDFTPRERVCFTGGVDWGIINDRTTAHFHRYSVTDEDVIDKWNVEEELNIANKQKEIYDSITPRQFTHPLNNTEMAELIVDFYRKCHEQYCYETDIIEIAVDNSAINFIETLNAIAERRELETVLVFHRGTKKKIKERVRLVLLTAGAGIFRVSDKCVNYIRELNMASYVDKPSSTNFRQGEDHNQDAVEYAITKEWDRLSAGVKSASRL